MNICFVRHVSFVPSTIWCSSRFLCTVYLHIGPFFASIWLAFAVIFRGKINNCGMSITYKIVCSHMYKNITSQDLIFIAGPEHFRSSEWYLTTLGNNRILRIFSPFMRRNARVKQVLERSPLTEPALQYLKKFWNFVLGTEYCLQWKRQWFLNTTNFLQDER